MYCLQPPQRLDTSRKRAEFAGFHGPSWYSDLVKDDRETDEALDAPRQGTQGEARTLEYLA